MHQVGNYCIVIHSEHVIFPAAPQQQQLYEGASAFRYTYSTVPVWLGFVLLPSCAVHHAVTYIHRGTNRTKALRYSVAYPGIFFGGDSTNSVEDRGQRGRGSGGGSPLVRGSGGSCNLVQEISFHIVKFS